MTDLRNFTNYSGYYAATIIQGKPVTAAFYREFYQQLKAYAANNGLYDFINQELQTTRIGLKDVKPLKNPANRVVEFYAALLWPGHDLSVSMPILAANEAILAPIENIQKWSNFAINKQMAARQFATLGDMFIKCNTKLNQAGEVTAVYQSFLDPTYVSEIKTDERGFLTYLRMDIPQYEEDIHGQEKETVHTEVWNKATQSWRIWLHEKGLNEELDKLGTPTRSGNFEESFGGDYIPIVYQEFRKDGNGRCSGAFVPALDKIDEINMKATRLAQLLFRHGKVDKMLVSDTTDANGRPLPPPKIDGLVSADNTVVIQGEKFYKLPSGYRIEHLIAQLDYESHLQAIQGDMDELQQDLPELAYNRIAEASDLSGRALRYMLEAAVSRLLEARGNGEAAFVRANEMCLSIGQNAGLFRNLGTFESGAFDHAFKPRPVLTPDKLEMAQTAVSWAGAGATNFIEVAKYVGIPEETAVLMARSDLEPNIPGGEPR
jgi:hypothetical protein